MEVVIEDGCHDNSDALHRAAAEESFADQRGASEERRDAEVNEELLPEAGRYATFLDAEPLHRLRLPFGSFPVWDKVLKIMTVDKSTGDFQLQILREQRQNQCVKKGDCRWLDVSGIRHMIEGDHGS